MWHCMSIYDILYKFDRCIAFGTEFDVIKKKSITIYTYIRIIIDETLLAYHLTYLLCSVFVSYTTNLHAQVRCTQFTILDDTIALEGDETFDLRFMRVSGANAMPGTNSQAWAQIIDDDG